MSKIKVGDWVRVGSSPSVDKEFHHKILQVKNVGHKYVDLVHGSEIRTFLKTEVITAPPDGGPTPVKPATPPIQTKMLHELIALAKAGVKFKAQSCHTLLPYKEKDFLTGRNWSEKAIIDLWQYEEIKEARVVEFTLNHSPADPPNDLNDLMHELSVGRWKVVATEVIE